VRSGNKGVEWSGVEWSGVEWSVVMAYQAAQIDTSTSTSTSTSINNNNNIFTYRTALVRHLSPSYIHSLHLNPPSIPINIELAYQQHRDYIDLLKRLIPEGHRNVIELPASDEHADCNFIEDTSIVVNGTVIIARLGHPLRQGEEIAVKDVYEGLNLAQQQSHQQQQQAQAQSSSSLHIEEVSGNSTFDGGDILFTGQHLFVGLSKRTNADAYDEIQSIIQQYEPSVTVVRLHVTQGLHLKSVITQLDTNVLLLADNPCGHAIRHEIEDIHGITSYEFIVVPDMVACNVLRIHENAVIQDGFPASEKKIREYTDRHRLQIHKLNMSEFIKSDGALTCGSILMQLGRSEVK